MPGGADRVRWLARPLPRIALLVGAVVLLLQLIPLRVDNHPIVVEPSWDSARTRQLVIGACYDCHSNHARSAWYEKVAPISWWIKGHVDVGRSALNFSACGAKGSRGVGESAETIREGSMPPSYYTWFGLHSGAKLSASERDALVAGLAATEKLGCRPVR